MPDSLGRPYARDIAEQIGITVSDFRARYHRGHAPAPVDYVNDGPALRAVWDPAVVDDYLHGRAVRLGTCTVTAVECPHTDCEVACESWAALNDHVKADHQKRNSRGGANWGEYGPCTYLGCEVGAGVACKDVRSTQARRARTWPHAGRIRRRFQADHPREN